MTWVRVVEDFYRHGSGRQAERVIKNEDDLWELFRSETAPVEIYPTAEDAFAAVREESNQDSEPR